MPRVKDPLAKYRGLPMRNRIPQAQRTSLSFKLNQDGTTFTAAPKTRTVYYRGEKQTTRGVYTTGTRRSGGNNPWSQVLKMAKSVKIGQNSIQDMNNMINALNVSKFSSKEARSAAIASARAAWRRANPKR